MFNLWPLFAVTAAYGAITTWLENKQPPPGHLIEIHGSKLHLWHVRSDAPDALNRPTVIIEHSLGGVEGYLLAQKIAELADVCVCDRAGYGWSDISRRSIKSATTKRATTSEERVRSLKLALTKANIKPPYILFGDSLGSYHMRLFAHTFPENVVGLVLTDGLHETALLKMP